MSDRELEPAPACCGAYCSEVCNCLTIAAARELELERRAREAAAEEGAEQ